MTPTSARRTAGGTGLRLILIPAAAMVLAVSGGCGYRLSGTVIEGPTPGLLVVNDDDPRLDEPGMGGAIITLTLDPQRLDARHLGSFVTDRYGRFDVPINETGAGFLEYDLDVLCRLAGYQAVQQRVRLPGSGKRLLIIMAPGRDTFRTDPDILDQTLRLGEQLQ